MKRSLPPDLQDLIKSEPEKVQFIPKKLRTSKDTSKPAGSNGKSVMEDSKSTQPVSTNAKINPNDFFSSSTTKPKDSKPIKDLKIDPNDFFSLNTQTTKKVNVEQVVDKKKKRNPKKFVFDWEESEDTSRQADPIIPVKTRTNTSIEKFKHWKDKDSSEMNERDWRIFKEDFNITCQGQRLVNPIRSWKELGFDSKLLKLISSHYTEPTPIQRQGIPVVVSGRDMIGIAETGSGKTATFVIPLAALIMNLPKLDYTNYELGPYGLIIVPTRELALQIEQEARKFMEPLGLSCVSVVGGHSIELQQNALLKGAHLIIGTPGRLIDILERRLVALGQLEMIVLDEADRMIDMGFETDLLNVLEGSKTNQTLMFSATMPAAIERLVRQYLKDPIKVIVGQQGQIVDRIEQRIMYTTQQRKPNILKQILNSNEFKPPIIIFVNRKDTCDTVQGVVEQLGWRVGSLHGGKSQVQRESVLEQFKLGKKQILIATDVAGRGLHVKNISLVINYDMAKDISSKNFTNI